ncbi:MAG: hypothetical protein F6K23_17255 [Okeania sp. SIO2C9]|nr:hypothetical protein [Okeania sp. SIO2C9]NEQ74635.1 hypothetical protein [Okeania sp. SIO2C9]
MGGWGVWEKLKNISLHHYHAGLPKKELWGNKLLADAEKLLENSQI